jgi:nitrogen fixation/metabolism regulation signal transduction histidine kinase
MVSEPRPRRVAPLERIVLALAFLAGLPAGAIALTLLWTGDYSLNLQITLTVLIAVTWLGFAWSARGRVVHSLLTLANMMGALREGDFSVRGRGAWHGDSMGLALAEVNQLADILKEQRLGAVEANALLRRMMGEVEVGVFAFDAGHRLTLVNRWGERMLGEPAERLMGRNADALGLAHCLTGGPAQTLDLRFPGWDGRWDVRRSTYRQDGVPHQLLVLSDVSRALREEERQAWKRLVRVLGHEINNSLTPISSIADSLQTMLERSVKAEDHEDDLRSGLTIISDRAEGLRRFMASYARLAKLPPPQYAPLDTAHWIGRVAKLEGRMAVQVAAGPPVTIEADGDQLDQLLINLVSNAVEAVQEQGGEVRVGWSLESPYLVVWVEDDGPGIPETGNLFVPFFTTKPKGSGIGLVLSRQIAEAHGGDLQLRNRSDRSGCHAELRLPLERA